jgi:hypothetical protein
MPVKKKSTTLNLKTAKKVKIDPSCKKKKKMLVKTLSAPPTTKLKDGFTSPLLRIADVKYQHVCLSLQPGTKHPLATISYNEEPLLIHLRDEDLFSFDHDPIRYNKVKFNNCEDDWEKNEEIHYLLELQETVIKQLELAVEEELDTSDGKMKCFGLFDEVWGSLPLMDRPLSFAKILCDEHGDKQWRKHTEFEAYASTSKVKELVLWVKSAWVHKDRTSIGINVSLVGIDMVKDE